MPFLFAAFLAVWITAASDSIGPLCRPLKNVIGAVGAAFTMTSVLLAITGIGIATSAWFLQPATGLPSDPNPPQFTFEPGPEGLAQPLDVFISVDLRSPEPPYEESCINIALGGPGLTQSRGWRLRVSGTDVPPVTDMHKSSSSKGEYQLWTENPADAHADMCWPTSQGTFVSTRGSNSIVALAEFSVIVGDIPVGPNPDVTVNSSLFDVPDWTIDSGPPPAPSKSDYKNWYWKSISGVYEVNTINNTPTLRVHSVAEASQEHTHEFLSGVFYGVGAAAGVAALQEGLNRWSEEIRRRTRGSGNRDRA